MSHRSARRPLLIAALALVLLGPQAPLQAGPAG